MLPPAFLRLQPSPVRSCSITPSSADIGGRTRSSGSDASGSPPSCRRVASDVSEALLGLVHVRPAGTGA